MKTGATITVIIIHSIFATFFLIPNFFSSICNAAELTYITKTRSLNQLDTLLSYPTDTSTFALGFFSLNSSSTYLGIWYHKITPRTIVWVANRDNPIPAFSIPTLQILDSGNLFLSDENYTVYWSTEITDVSSTSTDTVANLLSNGNLALFHSENPGDEGKALWQSFEFPTNTYLPGMRMLVNASMEVNKAFKAWRSKDDPSEGRYFMGVDPRGSPQIVIWGEGDARRWRSGYWNGLKFVGLPNMRTNYKYGFKLSALDRFGNMYFTYTLETSELTGLEISEDGFVKEMMFNYSSQSWIEYQSAPYSECDFYNKCGNFSTCTTETRTPVCKCMKGFEVGNEIEWYSGDYSSGCRRKTALKCQGTNSSLEDGFVTVENVKLPDYADSSEMSEEECEDECLNNCECVGYTTGPGHECLIWTDELVDVQVLPSDGRSLFLRLAGSELGSGPINAGSSGRKLSTSAIVIIVLSGACLLMFIALIWWYRENLRASFGLHRKSSLYNSTKNKDDLNDLAGPEILIGEGRDGTRLEIPLFCFDGVAAATDTFSEANLLRKGGFGPVYKGTLPDGQETAVKRLGGNTGQGLEEFKNEIVLIAKLQHRNLVRLIGWCVEGEDKMLLYEFMPNKSLDYFLFNAAKRLELVWKTRFSIIEGIARGLLYLHRDSRLRIIHRDLKASNILLDAEMNPKISDFGMARIFGGNQHEANTVRVVGTYGYMSPEYAMEGLFSEKSDVYSFGVLLLEIISGRRNTSLNLTEYSNLIKYAWSLWIEGRAIELVDESIKDSCNKSEVMRCIQIGLLCVQDSPANRPNMSTVIIMLESENVNLPSPQPPTTSYIDTDIWSAAGQEHDNVSANDLTLSVVAGR